MWDNGLLVDCLPFECEETPQVIVYSNCDISYDHCSGNTMISMNVNDTVTSMQPLDTMLSFESGNNIPRTFSERYPDCTFTDLILSHTTFINYAICLFKDETHGSFFTQFYGAGTPELSDKIEECLSSIFNDIFGLEATYKDERRVAKSTTQLSLERRRRDVLYRAYEFSDKFTSRFEFVGVSQLLQSCLFKVMKQIVREYIIEQTTTARYFMLFTYISVIIPIHIIIVD